MDPNPNNLPPDPNAAPVVAPGDAQSYLNELSAQPGGPKKFFDKKTLIIVGAFAAMIIIVVIILLSSSGGGSVSQQLALAKQQYSNILEVTKYGNKNLGSSSLSRTNATADLVLATQSHKISSLAGKTKLDKSTAATLGDIKTTTASLKAADSAGNLNSAVKNELNTRITDLTKTLNSIKSAKTTKANQDMAKKYIAQLEELQTRLNEN